MITRHIDSASVCIVVTDNASDRAKLKRRQFVDMAHRLKKDKSESYRKTVLDLTEPGAYAVRPLPEGGYRVTKFDWNPVEISTKAWKRLIAGIEARQWQTYWKERGL